MLNSPFPAAKSWAQCIERDGYAALPSIYSEFEAVDLAAAITAVLDHKSEAESIRDRRGTVYAGRNLLQVCTVVRNVWRRSPLIELLTEILGPKLGLVRGLFFDKPPGRTWSLAWHRDLTIAVRSHIAGSAAFSKPTIKAGVPHVEASLAVLENMLTLRIHLDDVTEENGPLQVIPGSHRNLESPVESPPTENLRSMCMRRGDVLAIRPLMVHSSISSRPETTCHRRILHLEFSGQPTLPDGYEWHDFWSLSQ